MTGQMGQTDGQTDGTRATARLSRRRWTAKTDGTAVVEAKWDTNRNLTVVAHVVRLHVRTTTCDV